MRWRLALPILLVAPLLMQWGTAFAHCLRLAGSAPGLTVEICSADGLRHVILPAEDGDGTGIAAAPACPRPGAFALPVLLAQATDAPTPPSAPIPLPPPSCQPSAPPTS